MAWAAIIFWIILKRRENLPVKTFKHELIGTGLLWFWLLVGISIASVRHISPLSLFLTLCG
jgi:hypothetical protein